MALWPACMCAGVSQTGALEVPAFQANPVSGVVRVEDAADLCAVQVGPQAVFQFKQPGLDIRHWPPHGLPVVANQFLTLLQGLPHLVGQAFGENPGSLLAGLFQALRPFLAMIQRHKHIVLRRIVGKP